MRTSTCIAWVCAATAAVSGCTSSPTIRDPPLSADYVGDLGRTVFDEVVVSLPFRGAEAPYQNLHVTVTVFVNPARRTPGNPYWTSGIVHRCDSRVAARLVEALTRLGEQSVESTPKLRETVRAEAQAVVDEAMKRWKDGSAYRAEVAVTQMYWTTPAVGGTTARPRRFPWD